MANKEIIINSEYSTSIKVYALIRCISHELEAATAKVLRWYGLSETQLDILDVLDNSELDAMSVNQIKAHMLDDNPNVSRSLNKLMKNKLIIKGRDLDDQRVVKIRITDEGEKLHRAADMALLRGRKKLNVTDKEFTMLFELLKKL